MIKIVIINPLVHDRPVSLQMDWKLVRSRDDSEVTKGNSGPPRVSLWLRRCVITVP